MLRRSTTSFMYRATPLCRPSMLVMSQFEMRDVITKDDKLVGSLADEFGMPPRSQEMINKYGRMAEFSNPNFAKVDTSKEVVLNTYPDGDAYGRIENHVDPKTYSACLHDEDFFRRHILKDQKPVDQEDRARSLDVVLNSCVAGLCFIAIRYMIAPLWWIGQPRMTLVFESNIEVEIGKMDDKECKTIAWRGKPVYLYKRSNNQLKQLAETPMSALKDPQTDEQRFKDKMEYCVVIGICTHLGCIPIPNEGMYMGFFCPCHGSHYDASGRIRVGPAPLNLEIPPHNWIDDNTIFLGK